jgi:hypothetical protein
VAVHVSRFALYDISRQLELAAATAAASRAGLMAKSPDTYADIALVLQRSVIDVVRRQSARLDVIASATPVKGSVVAVVER